MCQVCSNILRCARPALRVLVREIQRFSGSAIWKSITGTNIANIWKCQFVEALEGLTVSQTTSGVCENSRTNTGLWQVQTTQQLIDNIAKLPVEMGATSNCGWSTTFCIRNGGWTDKLSLELRNQSMIKLHQIMLWFAVWISNSHWRFIKLINLQSTMP